MVTTKIIVITTKKDPAFVSRDTIAVPEIFFPEN
jgi:hypothetical protein